MAPAVSGRIGYLGHEPLLYRELTPRENLELHAKLHGVAPARIAEVLAEAELTERADDPVRTLSRGLVQRAAICRAALHGPELLLLDEPRTSLDSEGTALLARAVHDVTDAGGGVVVCLPEGDADPVPVDRRFVVADGTLTEAG